MYMYDSPPEDTPFILDRERLALELFEAVEKKVNKEGIEWVCNLLVDSYKRQDGVASDFFYDESLNMSHVYATLEDNDALREYFADEEC